MACNAMAGTLPEEIGLLKHLEVLQLTFNKGISGPVPSSLGNLTRLQRFYAWNASFESLPATLGRLTDLRAIDLMDNQLRGSLPDELAKLQKVDTAYFDGNPKLRCPLSKAVANWLKQSVRYQADPCRPGRKNSEAGVPVSVGSQVRAEGEERTMEFLI